MTVRQARPVGVHGRVLAPAAVALAVAALAGCGGSGSTTTATTSSSPAASTSSAPATNGIDKLTATEVMTKASAAFQAAPSVRIQGEMIDAGKKAKVDSQLQGKDGRVTLGLDAVSMELLVKGEAAYISGNDAFWTSSVGATGAKTMSGKYLKTTVAGKDAKDMMGFIDRGKIVSDILPKDSFSSGKKATLNGQPVWELSDGAGSVYDIALTGEPLPLQISSAKDGKLTLTYGITVDLTEPPAAKVLDASKMK
ncbi:MAG TPA: hypothetical protein VFP72_00510 [Kineosporiaceae bacterium]|nr:hypothetical protein [Kineosporiaceae bacterium]